MNLRLNFRDKIFYITSVHRIFFFPGTVRLHLLINNPSQIFLHFAIASFRFFVFFFFVVKANKIFFLIRFLTHTSFQRNTTTFAYISNNVFGTFFWILSTVGLLVLPSMFPLGFFCPTSTAWFKSGRSKVSLPPAFGSGLAIYSPSAEFSTPTFLLKIVFTTVGFWEEIDLLKECLQRQENYA